MQTLGVERFTIPDHLGGSSIRREQDSDQKNRPEDFLDIRRQAIISKFGVGSPADQTQTALASKQDP